MPKAAPAKAELHGPELRELIKNKIRELEFKVALELFGAVARLVPKDEVAKNPKAKAALDKEWENLRTKGVWDESKFASAKALWTKLAKVGRPFIFTTSSKHVMKRVVTFPRRSP